MSKESKRKPRKELIATVDLLYPIKSDQLGTQDDPCFGKLFDPKAPECQRCGDSELCQIKMGQKLKDKREKKESEQKFRDIGEKAIYDQKPTIKDLKSGIRKIIRTTKSISKKELIEQAAAQFRFKEDKVERIFSSMLKTTNKFTLKNNNVIWDQK